MRPALSLSLANRMDEVPRLLDRLEAFGAEHGLPDALTFRLTLALDEVVTNIVRYGFDDAAPHTIRLSIAIEQDGSITAIVEDDGRPFDPGSVPPADVDAPIEQRKIGGLGVHLVRSMTTSMRYRREGEYNVLSLRLGPPL